MGTINIEMILIIIITFLFFWFLIEIAKNVRAIFSRVTSNNIKVIKIVLGP